jgi:hypothetical protein
VKKIVLFFLPFFIILVCIIVFGIQLELELKELSVDFDNRGYLKSISDLKIYQDFLFVADNVSHLIAKFKINSSKLEFINFLGKPGQGPGDIELPSEISIWDGVIAIKDQFGISFFKIDGSFVNKFRLFSPTFSFIYENGIIFIANSNPNVPNLIEAYSQEGKRLYSFGNKRDILPGQNIGDSFNPLSMEMAIFSGKLVADSKHIYYINRRFGTLTKFSLSGEKIGQAELAQYFGDNGKAIKDANKAIFLKDDYSARPGAKKIPEYFIFRDAVLRGNQIYIMSDLYNITHKELDSELRIICIDKNSFQYISTYQAALPEGPNLFLFFLGASRSSIPTFYVDILSESDFKFYQLVPHITK